jgi:hypothetical protein
MGRRIYDDTQVGLRETDLQDARAASMGWPEKAAPRYVG